MTAADPYHRRIHDRCAALAERNVTVLERYIASKIPRTQQTMLEGLDRIAKMNGKVPERVDWGALRRPHTLAIASALAGSTYRFKCIQLAMTALRGVLRQAHAMGRMSDAELAEAIGLDKPWRIREHLIAMDKETEERRNRL